MNNYQQIREAVSPVRVAQFLQVENQMALFVDINIASEELAISSKPANHE